MYSNNNILLHSITLQTVFNNLDRHQRYNFLCVSIIINNVNGRGGINWNLIIYIRKFCNIFNVQ